MAYIHPAWEEYQRQRFTRSDGDRYLKPPPFDHRAFIEEYRAAKAAEAARSAPVTCSLDDPEVRRLVAEIKLDLLRLQYWCKAYNPNQPRVPKGNPDGGQWTKEGDDAGLGDHGNDERLTTIDMARDDELRPDIETVGVGVRSRARGHHYNPQQVFNRYPLPAETRKVFDEATTGRLRDPSGNFNDRQHRLYNQAVDEHFKAFIKKNNIDVKRMTPAQAHELLDEILESRDPRIRNLNMRIWMREINELIRRRFRFPRGSE